MEELLWELTAHSQPLDVLAEHAASNLFQQMSQAGPEDISLRKILFFIPLQRSGVGQAGWQEGRPRPCRALSPLYSLCLPSCVSSTCCSARDPTLKHGGTALFEEEKELKKDSDPCELAQPRLNPPRSTAQVKGLQ